MYEFDLTLWALVVVAAGSLGSAAMIGVIEGTIRLTNWLFDRQEAR